MNEVPVSFTLDQLWALNDLVRHESEQDRWSYPPTSLALNEQIAQAILTCEESKLSEYHLLLSRRDTFTIDYNVRRGMASPGGQKIGKEILLKAFEARRSIAGGWEATAIEPKLPNVEQLMEQWKVSDAHAVPGEDPNHQPE